MHLPSSARVIGQTKKVQEDSKNRNFKALNEGNVLFFLSAIWRETKLVEIPYSRYMPKGDCRIFRFLTPAGRIHMIVSACLVK